jgi:Zn-finger nucleic acid-binding protein
MECPKCHESLETVAIGHVRVERCPRCAGTWYDKNELRVLKDKESKGDYSWIHFDLWKDIEWFRVPVREQKRYSCPRDEGPLTTVHYGESPIAVDICPTCKGMWLDKEEYGEIVRYLESVVDSSSTEDYLKDIREELADLLRAREGPLTAMKDVGKILYLLELRFVVEHPGLASILPGLPRF